MQNLRLQIFLKSIHFIALISKPWIQDEEFSKLGKSADYLNIISTLSPDDLQNNDYQNSNIKKVGGINLKQICKINILAHDTGAENEFELPKPFAHMWTTQGKINISILPKLLLFSPVFEVKNLNEFSAPVPCANILL